MLFLRLFRVESDKKFKEYLVQDFKVEYREEDLESLLETNPDAILEGISRNMKPSEIASKLSVGKWVVVKDIKKMRYQRNSELEKAYETAKKRRKNKTKPIAVRAEKRFKEMTGMSLEEKTFINMLHFHKTDLLEILD